MSPALAYDLHASENCSDILSHIAHGDASCLRIYYADAWEPSLQTQGNASTVLYSAGQEAWAYRQTLQCMLLLYSPNIRWSHVMAVWWVPYLVQRTALARAE